MGMSNYMFERQLKWQERLDAVFKDRLNQTTDDFPEYAEFFQEAYDNRETPLVAFENFHEAEYGETWEAINGQFGVGA